MPRLHDLILSLSILIVISNRRLHDREEIVYSEVGGNLNLQDIDAVKFSDEDDLASRCRWQVGRT